MRTKRSYSAHTVGLLAGCGYTLLSSGYYFAAKIALSKVAPLTTLCVRTFGSALVLLVVAWLAKLPIKPPKRDTWRILFAATLGVSINQGLFMFGLSHGAPTSHAVVIHSLTPLIVYAYAIAMKLEAPSRSRLTGILIAVVGMVVLIKPGTNPAHADALVGDLVILAAVMVWAHYTVVTQPLVLEHGALQMMVWVSLLALPTVFLGTLVMHNHLHPVPIHDSAALGSLAYLVVISSVGVYVVWSFALTKLAPSQVAVFANLKPFVVAVGSVFAFGELLGAKEWISGALVLTGIYIVQKQNVKALEAPPAPVKGATALVG